MEVKMKAIFPDENPLSPRIIEGIAIIDDDSNKLRGYKFPAETPVEDILFFLEFTSNPTCRVEILGVEEK